MVVRIAIGRGVSNHNGRDTFTPERPVVTPVHARYPAKRSHMLDGEVTSGTKRCNRLFKQAARAEIRDEPDEVTFIWVE